MPKLEYLEQYHHVAIRLPGMAIYYLRLMKNKNSCTTNVAEIAFENRGQGTFRGIFKKFE
jgi:hypothetical protein